jgi:hypothetical protein
VVHERSRVVPADPAARFPLYLRGHPPRLTQVLPRHAGQFRQEAADVAAVRVKPLALACRAVQAADRRLPVRAHRGDPLPVPVVDRLVTVQQHPHEPRLTAAPVDAQVLDQKGRGHKPHRPRQPPLPAQLPHARVNQREPGPALGPGRIALLVGVPRQAVPVAFLELGVGAGGEVRHQLLVEVPPAQLPPEGGRAFPAGQVRLHPPRGQAAEPQVRGEPGIPRRRCQVACGRVPVHRPGQESLQAGEPGRLPAPGGRGHLRPQPQFTQGRQPAHGQPAREGDPRWRGKRGAPGKLAPGAVIGGEHGVRAAGRGADRAGVVGGVLPRVGTHRHPLSRQRAVHQCGPAVVIGAAAVRGHVHLNGACRPCQGRQFGLRRAMPDDQPAAARGKLAIQVCQAFQEEPGSRPGCVAAPQQPVVQAEHGHHPVMPGQGGPQRRVVVNAQVPAEPDDRYHCCRE